MRRADSNILNRVNHAGAKLLARRRLLLAAFAVLLCGTAASAQTNIYQLRGSNNYGLYVYNVPANTNTTVFQPYPVNPGGTNSATIAQRPSDGMLFYVMYNGAPGNNPVMFRFNPATPNVAPVQVGTGLGGAVPSSLRMAFDSTGTLYYLPDTRDLYTINTATGIATDTGVNIGSAATITSGGDMAFSSTGTLYISTSSKTLWTASITTGAVTQIGNAPVAFTPSANATIGLAFNAAGDLLAQTQNPNNIYRIPLPVGATSAPTGVLVRAGDGDTGSTGDMASANVPQPNLSITKTDGVTTVYRGGPISYTIVVTNSSAYPVTGTVTDTVPASVSAVTWNCVPSAGSTCAAASGSGNAISTSATLLVGGTATYTVTGTLSAAASGTLVNTATVAVPATFTDSSPANNTATDTDTINLNANLAITKTDGLANINPGSAVTYTIVVSNAGPDASNGSIVTDTVPASITGVTWTCGAATGGATCGAASGSGNAISTTANLPAASSVTYTVSGTLSLTATGTLTNTARVITPASGVSDPTDLGRTGAGNNSATDNTTINPIPIVNLVKSVSPSGSQSPGTDLAYTINFSNTGSAVARTLVITDPIPANTDFRIGSMTSALGTTGLTVVYAYSNNGGATYVYAPVSGGGGAPAGYDRLVTNVRFTFTGNLSQTAPNNAGSVGFTARIR